MENEQAVEVLEEVAGTTLNKVVVFGTIVAGGALAFVLVPKAVRRMKRLLTKKSEFQTEEVSTTQTEEVA